MNKVVADVEGGMNQRLWARLYEDVNPQAAVYTYFLRHRLVLALVWRRK